MKSTNSTILLFLNVLFWIVFIGFCLKTGAILVSFLVSILLNPDGAKDLYLGLDLFELFSFDLRHYAFIVLLLLVLTGLKSYILFLILLVFRNLKLAKPFGHQLTNLFLSISYSSLITGVLAIFASGYCKWILKEGVSVPIDWGGDEILFFAAVIYLLALIYKKGTDFQVENELTI